MKCHMCDIIVVGGVKFCDECKTNLLAFVKREKERNTSCKTLNRKKYEKRKPEETKANLSQYGLTQKDYKRMLTEQENKCAICRTSPGARPLSVDHNHNSGQVRGLLCNNCNVALGFLQDDPWVVQRAADYLKKHTRKILALVQQS